MEELETEIEGILINGVDIIKFSDDTTVMRWVLRNVPEYERLGVSVRGGRHYLYRAVDRDGKSVASLLCYNRSTESAQAFFRSAVATQDSSRRYCLYHVWLRRMRLTSR